MKKPEPSPSRMLGPRASNARMWAWRRVSFLPPPLLAQSFAGRPVRRLQPRYIPPMTRMALLLPVAAAIGVGLWLSREAGRPSSASWIRFRRLQCLPWPHFRHALGHQRPNLNQHVWVSGSGRYPDPSGNGWRRTARATQKCTRVHLRARRRGRRSRTVPRLLRPGRGYGAKPGMLALVNRMKAG